MSCIIQKALASDRHNCTVYGMENRHGTGVDNVSVMSKPEVLLMEHENNHSSRLILHHSVFLARAIVITT